MKSHRVGGAGCIINLRCLSRVVSFRQFVMTFFFCTNSRQHLRCAEFNSLAAFRADIFKLKADCVDRVLPLSPVQEKTILIKSVGRHFLQNRRPFKGASVCYFCYFDAEVDQQDGWIIGRGSFRSDPECCWTVCQSVIQLRALRPFVRYRWSSWFSSRLSPNSTSAWLNWWTRTRIKRRGGDHVTTTP